MVSMYMTLLYSESGLTSPEISDPIQPPKLHTLEVLWAEQQAYEAVDVLQQA